MTTPKRRAPYRPVRDTLGFPCPQLYITQYVRQDGTCDVIIRADGHRSDGSMAGGYHTYNVPLATPWECVEGVDHATLEDVQDYVHGWLLQWFGTQRILPLAGGWDERPER